uniref:Uncharacterized protein n=1 Tax=Lepeophtheirus salmonis TaxID=72036 RepID=A0A0K2V6K0_LEPSM
MGRTLVIPHPCADLRVRGRRSKSPSAHIHTTK